MAFDFRIFHGFSSYLSSGKPAGVAGALIRKQRTLSVHRLGPWELFLRCPSPQLSHVARALRAKLRPSHPSSYLFIQRQTGGFGHAVEIRPAGDEVDQLHHLPGSGELERERNILIGERDRRGRLMPGELE